MEKDKPPFSLAEQMSEQEFLDYLDPKRSFGVVNFHGGLFSPAVEGELFTIQWGGKFPYYKCKFSPTYKTRRQAYRFLKKIAERVAQERGKTVEQVMAEGIQWIKPQR